MDRPELREFSELLPWQYYQLISFRTYDMTHASRLLISLMVAFALLFGFFAFSVVAEAAPPGKCSPWPECKDSGGGDSGSDEPAPPSPFL